MEANYLPIKYHNGILTLLDQRKLPLEEIFIDYNTIEGVHSGIKDMVVRGAPCIGFTAIFGMAIWLRSVAETNMNEASKAIDFLKSARPTAVNLAFELDRVFEIIKENFSNHSLLISKVEAFGNLQIFESEKKNRAMAEFAEQDLMKKSSKDKYRILTHCNTGFLACGSIGTALGVVQNLAEKNKIDKVWVDETRPYLQGSRLTAYELVKLGVNHQIVVEGAASYLMRTGQVDAIFTGADRIVANGDTANKVGTSNLAIIAKHYNIPFYIVAPSSTFDLETKTGSNIEIELRDQNEILEYRESRIAPLESTAYNPSFDITDGKLITGIINENGIAHGDYIESLRSIL